MLRRKNKRTSPSVILTGRIFGTSMLLIKAKPETNTLQVIDILTSRSRPEGTNRVCPRIGHIWVAVFFSWSMKVKDRKLRMELSGDGDHTKPGYPWWWGPGLLLQHFQFLCRYTLRSYKCQWRNMNRRTTTLSSAWRCFIFYFYNDHKMVQGWKEISGGRQGSACRWWIDKDSESICCVHWVSESAASWENSVGFVSLHAAGSV